MSSTSIGENSYIVPPFHGYNYDCRKIDGTKPNISFGSYTSIGANCSFVSAHHSTQFATTSRPPNNMWSHGLGNPDGFSRGDIHIGNDVWIGVNCTILDNVTIGDGAVVAACSVVTKNVEPYSIVGGNPAKHIRWRFSQEHISTFQAVKWWEFDKETVQRLNPYTEDIDGFLERCKLERGL